VRQIRFLHLAITCDNYRDVLKPLLTCGPGRGMVVNLSVDTSSVDLMEFCKDVDAFYIDTVVEPWPGLYLDGKRSLSERSNYALRESVLDLRRRRPGGVTAVSCCGANPGMVSWMVKQALVDIAKDLKLDFVKPGTREEWGRLMQRVGVKASTSPSAIRNGRIRPSRAASSSIPGRCRRPAAFRVRLGHA
jgi:homospermidine synthase